MTTKRKSVELSIQTKKEILDEFYGGITQRKLAEKYGVAKSTIGNIIRNSESITTACRENCSGKRRRKLKTTRNKEVNVATWEFYKKCKSNNIPVSGPMLQAKAKEIANELNVLDFHASNGWLDSFRARHNIKFRSSQGDVSSNVPKPDSPEKTNETKKVSTARAVTKWRQNLEEILEDYPVENQFVVGEFGFLYRRFAKITEDEDEKVSYASERFVVLLCCSASGEKLMPLVVGREDSSSFCHHFFNLEHSPVIWKTNSNALMSSQIFDDWLESLNSQMKMENRNIVLLLEGAASHNSCISLSHVKLTFLPSHVDKPLEMGIFKAVKLQYRMLMLRSLVTKVRKVEELTSFLSSISAYDAMRWLSFSWQELSLPYIIGCFEKAGFPQGVMYNTNFSDFFKDMEDLLKTLPKWLRCFLPCSQRLANFDDGMELHEDVVANTSDTILSNVIARFKKSSKDTLVQCNTSENQSLGHKSTTADHSKALDLVQRLQRYAFNSHPELIVNLMDLYTKIESYWGQSIISNGLDSY